jgi:hypothetical protein
MINEYQPGGSEPSDPQQSAPPVTGEPQVEAQERIKAQEGPSVADEARSVWAMMRSLADQGATLIRQEAQLARAELRETLQTYSRDAIMLGSGAVVALAGVLVLLAAAVAGLYVILNKAVAWYVAAWLSPLIIGVVVALIGWGLIARARRSIRRTSLKLQKTIDTVREGAQWLKDRLT